MTQTPQEVTPIPDTNNVTPPQGQPGTAPEGLTDHILPTIIEELQAPSQREPNMQY